MAENIINKDLVTLYRGQPMFGPSRYLQMANQGTPTIMGGSTQGLTTNQLSKLAGQYYTTDLPVAEKYAGKTGKILSTQVPSNYVNESGRFNRFQNKVTGLPSGNYTNAGVSGNSYLVPKSTLKNYPSKINIGKTISNYMGNLDYPGKVIKAGYDLGQYGPGGVLKEIGSEGLGFLKNNAIKGLTTLGSLPVQAALMTLGSTPANADEANMTAEDFRALAEAQNTISPTTNRNFDRDFSQLPSYGDAISRPSENYNMDQSFYMNPNSVERPQNMFQRLGGAMQDGIGSLQDVSGKGIDLGKMAMSGIGNAIMPGLGFVGNLLSGIDKFDTLSPEDQSFILEQAGGNQPSKDPFGINIRSARGNYADYVRNKGIYAKGKRGDYYRNLQQQMNDRKAKAAEQLKAEQARIEAAYRSQAGQYGGENRQQEREDAGPGYSGSGTAAEMGSFRDGGLASMFVRRG